MFVLECEVNPKKLEASWTLINYRAPNDALSILHSLLLKIDFFTIYIIIILSLSPNHLRSSPFLQPTQIHTVS